MGQEAGPGWVSLRDSPYARVTDGGGLKPCPPIDTPVLGVIRIWSRPVGERVTLEVAAPLEAQPESYAGRETSMRDLMHLRVCPFIMILRYPALTIVAPDFDIRLALLLPAVA